jgi:hypothetical protein
VLAREEARLGRRLAPQPLLDLLLDLHTGEPRARAGLEALVQLPMEADVGDGQLEGPEQMRHHVERGFALIAIEGVVAGVEIADHLDHERARLDRPVVPLRARRRTVPVAAGPQPAGRVDRQMLRDVFPALLHVEGAHRLDGAQPAEVGACRLPRVVQMHGSNPACQGVRVGQEQLELRQGESDNGLRHGPCSETRRSGRHVYTTR